MWKRKFFLKNKKNHQTLHFFVVVVCLCVLLSKIDFKTLKKKVRKRSPVSHHYFWTEAMENGCCCS